MSTVIIDLFANVEVIHHNGDLFGVVLIISDCNDCIVLILGFVVNFVVHEEVIIVVIIFIMIIIITAIIRYQLPTVIDHKVT